MENKLTNFVFEKIGVGRFGKYLDLTSFRHKLTASNVANVSTPSYRAKDIDFEGELARVTERSRHLQGTTTHANHIATGQSAVRSPKVVQEKVEPGDMNSVDIDREIPKMAQNELLYTIGAKLLERKFSGLQKAITSE